jgi:hypothetical protein
MAQACCCPIGWLQACCGDGWLKHAAPWLAGWLQVVLQKVDAKGTLGVGLAFPTDAKVYARMEFGT